MLIVAITRSNLHVVCTVRTAVVSIHFIAVMLPDTQAKRLLHPPPFLSLNNT